MEYGLFGKKYVLRTFEGEITLHGEREDLPKEEISEKEQELLKQVNERKNVLVGGDAPVSVQCHLTGLSRDFLLRWWRFVR